MTAALQGLSEKLVKRQLCDRDDVAQLQKLLFGEARESKRPRSAAATSRTAPRRAQAHTRAKSTAKAPPLASRETLQGLTVQQCHALATNAFNYALAILGNAVKKVLACNCSKALRNESGAEPSAQFEADSEEAESTTKQMLSTGSTSITTDCDEQRDHHTAIAADIGLYALEFLQTSESLAYSTFHSGNHAQLIGGILAFCGKSIALDLRDAAAKQLASLHKLLEILQASNRGVRVASHKAKPIDGFRSSDTKSEGLAFLLKFDGLNFKDADLLDYVCSYQMLVLRLMASNPVTTTLEAALEHLDCANRTSIINILLLRTRYKDAVDRATLHLQNVSKILMHCADKLAHDENQRASAAGLLFRLRALSLCVRMAWSDIKGHKKSIDKDLVSPLMTFLSVYVNSTSDDAQQRVKLVQKVYHTMEDFASQHSSVNEPRLTRNRNLRLFLGCLMYDSGDISEAQQMIDDALCSLDSPKGHDHGDSLHFMVFSRLGRQAFAVRQATEEREEAWRHLRLASDILGKGFRDGDIGFELTIREATLLRNRAYDYMRKYISLQLTTETNVRDQLAICYDMLSSFNLLILRTLSLKTNCEAKSALRALETRQALVCRLVKQSLEIAINMTRMSLRHDLFSSESISSMLKTCKRILQLLLQDPESFSPINDWDASLLQGLCVDLAKLYFQSVNTGSQSRDELSTGLKSIQNGLELCNDLSVNDRRLAQVYLAHYRKGRLLLKVQECALAHTSFWTCIAECVVIGIALEAADIAISSPLNTVFANSFEMQIFASANKALLELEVQDGSEFASPNIEEYELRVKAIILECRLGIISEWSSKHLGRKGLQKLLLPTFEGLLECYPKSVHPLRNTLLKARALQICADSGIAADDDMAASAQSTCETELHEDAGLEIYQEHIMATLEASRGLYTPLRNIDNLIGALGTWISILTSNDSWNEVRIRIYDLDMWLVQLEAMSDCFEMLGCDDERLQTLAAIACVRANSNGPAKSEKCKALNQVGQALAMNGFVSQSENWISAAASMRGILPAEMGTDVSHYTAKIEWLLATNEPSKSFEYAQNLMRQFQSGGLKFEDALSGPVTNILPSKARRLVAASQLFATCSAASLGKGALRESLLFARRSASLLEFVWRSVESRYGIEANDTDATLSAVDGLARRLSRMSISPRRNRKEAKDTSIIPGSAFWSLSRRLFRALLHLSSVSRYVGSVSGALAANEQAGKIADATGVASLIVEALVDRAQLMWRSGHDDEAKEYFHQAESYLAENSVHVRARALFLLALGEFHGHRKHWRNEQDAYARMEPIIEELANSDKMQLIGKLLQLCYSPIEKDETIGQRPLQDTIHSRGRSRGTSQARQISRKATTHGRTNSKSNASVASSITHIERPRFLSQAILIQKIESMLMQSNLVAAKKFLQALDETCTRHDSNRMYTFLQAKTLLQEALANMAAHAIYGMLPESTLSVPNIPFSTQQGGFLRSDIAGEETSNRHRRQSSQAIISSRVDIIETLTAAMDAAVSMSSENNYWDATALSRKYEVMAACSMLFSFAGAASGGQQTSPSQLASHLDCFRNEMTTREHIYMETERVNRLAATATDWPMTTDLEYSTAILSLSGSDEELTEVLPNDWVVVSLNLREQDEHLYLTRYVAKKSPFVLRLPLNRQTGDELDEEKFSLDQAREELQDIVESSNNMVHKARDAPDEMKVKGAKTQWWTARDELDARLRSLLVNMENIWFGGFRSVFTVHDTTSTAAEKFQQSFEAVLARHLPSRQPSSKRSKTRNVSLDTSILELFTGLMTRGDDGVADLDEALNDLLYFVVDILQYSGEANAYDEIDFDAMIVEIQDALLDFRDGLSEAAGVTAKKKQVILVLDRQLHLFPWESMPCLEGRSVSRVPSIKDICDRIQLMRIQSCPDGVIVSRQTGTYLLNPSKDLPRTQKRFERPLSSLLSSGWSSTVGRAITEEEFEMALSQGSSQSNRGIVIYIGHGSGAQYIRAKTIRRLRPHCNAALLFGCSSVKLKESGEFEAQGNPKTYLAAGAPAVLGSLWDVTDGDVDKFAASVLQGWGLIAAGSVEAEEQQQKGKGKVKRKANTGAARSMKASVDERISLSDAVSKGKDHCYLRYLNGAAMVVYGVPLYLD